MRDFDIDVSRAYKWQVLTYLPYEDVLSVCKTYKNVLHYSFAFHDKDFLDNELQNPEQPHFHVNVVLRDARVGRTLTNLFSDSSKNAGNAFVLPIKDIQKAYEYLWHKNETESRKYHYDPSIVVSDSVDYWNNLSSERNNLKDNSYIIVRDICSGMRPYTLLKLYGRDYVYHRKIYLEMACDVLCLNEQTRCTVLSLGYVPSAQCDTTAFDFDCDSISKVDTSFKDGDLPF